MFVDLVELEETLCVSVLDAVCVSTCFGSLSILQKYEHPSPFTLFQSSHSSDHSLISSPHSTI